MAGWGWGVCPGCGRASGLYQLCHVFLLEERPVGAALGRDGGPGGQQGTGFVLALLHPQHLCVISLLCIVTRLSVASLLVCF